MPCDLGDLPGTQFGENALRQRFALIFEAPDLFIDIDFGVVADVTQLLDFCFEFGDRLLEIKEFQIHGWSFSVGSRNST